MLGRADRPGGLAARLRHAGVWRGHELIENGVVVGEEAVECLVIVAPTQVDSCHEIDLDWLTDATAGARSVSDILDNGRLEGCGLASLVPRKPEKLHGLLGNGGAA